MKAWIIDIHSHSKHKWRYIHRTQHIKYGQRQLSCTCPMHENKPHWFLWKLKCAYVTCKKKSQVLKLKASAYHIWCALYTCVNQCLYVNKGINEICSTNKEITSEDLDWTAWLYLQYLFKAWKVLIAWTFNGRTKMNENITLNKIINATLVVAQIFHELKTFSMNTKGQFLSNIVHKSV